MCTLSKAAERFFCDQALEVEFDMLVSQVRDLHTKRSQLAHGTVAALPIVPGLAEGKSEPMQGFGYAVVPPWYALHQLTKHDSVFYVLNAAMIDGITRKFVACSADLRVYRSRLDASWREPEAPFGLCVWLGKPQPQPPDQ